MSKIIGAMVLVVLTAGLSACKPPNKFAPPPPPEVSVAAPLRHSVQAYLEETGNTEAFNSVSLVARVEGFLSQIDYQDGARVKRGDSLFIIEQLPYQAKLQQAQATLAADRSALVLSQIEYDRQQTLYKQNVTAASTLDKARAARDSDQANIDNAQAGVTQAAINLGYTHVSAPFDGIVSRHLVSVGALVGNGTATQLATLTQLDPIYVSFNVSEQDVLQIRANLRERRLTLEQINQVPAEIGLMNEDGFPHKGRLDYVSPTLDANTGTLMVRAVLPNPTRALLPGFFARVRIPSASQTTDALLVPRRVIAEDQEGRYVLVVGPDNKVAQRFVRLGQEYGDLVVATGGLQPDDRVIVTTTGLSPPGSAVVPKQTTLAVPPELASAKPLDIAPGAPP